MSRRALLIQLRTGDESEEDYFGRLMRSHSNRKKFSCKWRGYAPTSLNMSLSLLTNIVKACKQTPALELLRKSNSTVPPTTPGPLRSLLDLVDSLMLESFGTVTGKRAEYSTLPDSLIELERPLFSHLQQNDALTVFPRDNITLPPECDIETSSEKVKTYMSTLYTDPEGQFVLQVFFLPKNAKMPLHDHPSMAVLSKIVAGSIDICSYTLDKDAFSGTNHISANGNLISHVAPHHRHIYTSSDPTSILTPELGNLHAMRALEPTLFFDILTPPYEPPQRDCIYYSLRKYSQSSFKPIGSEISAESIMSLWEDPEKFDPSKTAYKLTPYLPSWFYCIDKPWNGPEISL